MVAATRQEQARQPTDVTHGSQFDLYFLRWSIFTDGILTACVSLAQRGWHMYVAATVLPFASGTGPAAKGVILDFVRQENRADALGAIALVEKLGQCSWYRCGLRLTGRSPGIYGWIVRKCLLRTQRGGEADVGVSGKRGESYGDGLI